MLSRAIAGTGRYEPQGFNYYVPTRKGGRVANIFEMGIAMESLRRKIAEDRVGHIRVSTVFLCLDHDFLHLGSDSRPVLWETMLFTDDGGDSDADAFLDMEFGPDDAKYLGSEQWRYTSREAAAAHHLKLVEMLRSGLN